MTDRILVLSPDAELRIFLSSILKESGYDVYSLASSGDAAKEIRKREAALRLAFLDAGDADLSGGLEALDRLREADPSLPVVLLAEGDAKGREAAQALGAADAIDRGAYVGSQAKVTMETILEVTRAVERAGRVEATVKNLARRLAYYEEVYREKYRPVGQSEAFEGMMAEVRRLAPIPRPVLIRGERGTGKELVAGAIHFMGPRARAPFVTVNCAAFHGNLLESEMFGHEKGAFTGADRRKTGRFEMADGGTLFLDEIGNMALDFQAKILRVLEYQTFERVAGTETVEVDVRVIAATNADLKGMMEAGTFREDLYDRLAFGVIEVPPLRDRPGDIEVLAEAFSSRIAAEVPGVERRRFAPEVMRRFRSYAWPGNVRELKNVVERLTCLEGSGPVGLSDLPPELLAAPSSPKTFEERVDAFQVGLLMDALRETRGSQKRAASRLGLTYDQFRHMVRKYDLMEKFEEGG